MTNFEQLSDGIFIATHFFGTLEDNSFNLGGGTHIFPDDPGSFLDNKDLFMKPSAMRMENLGLV